MLKIKKFILPLKMNRLKDGKKYLTGVYNYNLGTSYSRSAAMFNEN